MQYKESDFDRATRLQDTLLTYAPDDKAVSLCAAIYVKMRKDDLSPTAIESQVASAISDGLSYGNWPWIISN